MQMPAFETLKDQLESEIVRAEARPGKAYKGADWWQYTDAEKVVFSIRDARWPRMITTFECYETFKDITSHRFDKTLVQAARKQFPQWTQTRNGMPVTALAEFIEFSAEFGRLKAREAFAVFEKNEAWQVRQGLFCWKDE